VTAIPWPGAPTLPLPAERPSSRSHDEAIEVTLAQSGDGRAFERLYRRHVTRVHGLVRRMVPDADAEELTQDVFVRAWQKLGTFRGDAAFGTWLHRLAVNLMLERRAELGTRRTRYEDDDASLSVVTARRETPEVAMDMERAMARLPEGAREVFVLHDVEGYKHEEIAGMLSINIGTSKSQLHRARMALRGHLSR
jgi:RNA polymerase sigma-70 factor (ECF subfamily)